VSATADELAITVSRLPELEGYGFDQIDAVIVSTVVPQLGPEWEELCGRHIEGPCQIVGPNLKTGMPILVDNRTNSAPTGTRTRSPRTPM
jgi:type III pantothenate kinase